MWVLGSRTSLAAVSRYAERSVEVEGADEREKVDFLLKLAVDNDLRGWVLFPDGDKSVSLMARHHEALSQQYTLTVPPWDMAQWALEKAKTYELCEELGIDYPRTLIPTSEDQVRDLDFDFPLILKPMNHEGTDRFSIINGAWRADDKDELLALYRDANEAVGGKPVIAIQEMVPGLGEAHLSYATLCKDGEIKATIMVRRTRLLPVDFGSSAFAETVDSFVEIEEPARQWIERIRYTGLADFDFKRHPQTGAYKLLDVNIRPWGWHPLATYAGVDFPYLTWRLAQGFDVPFVTAEVGVKWIRTPYDVMAALQLARRKKLTWGEYARSLSGAHHEMYQLDDLMPAVVEIPLLFKLVWNKMQGR